ncbi:hypothetical protein [Vreelandella profundi]|uniref:hypothetical protein n=1 Tax=Vreelandella profundi TaxID=2852117 RepID=UPI001F4902CE|nr:hypothetical protein [Halomonas profundi]
MLQFYGIMILITLVVSIVADGMTALMAVICYLVGCAFSILFMHESKKERRLYSSLFQIVFFSGLLYASCSYLYMEFKGYSYLLAADVDYYFMPKTISFLDLDDFGLAMTENWKSYNLFSGSHEGYFAYIIPFAYLCDYLGADLYFSMQLSTLLVFGLSSIVIFRLFLLNEFTHQKAFKNTLLICLFSILFFYSSVMLRDIHIMFTYLLAIYFTFRKDFSFVQLLKLLGVVLVSCTLRIETGLFLFIMIPVYLLYSLQVSRNKVASILFSFTLSLIGIVALFLYSNRISSVFMRNSDIYLDSDKGSGVVGALQTIPVAGKLLSIIYNAVQPLPLWSKLSPGVSNYRPEAYNLMTFPMSFASLFNWVVICVIFIAIVNGKIRKKLAVEINKPLFYNLLIGFVFLYIQASVISQRRLMAFYVVYYILFFLILRVISQRDRVTVMFLSVISYFLIQLLALVYII